MDKLKIYCLCLRDNNFNTVQKLGYTPVGLGDENLRYGVAFLENFDDLGVFNFGGEGN